MLKFTIRSQEDMEDIIRKAGIMPLFSNSIEGFSIDEHTPLSVWNDPDGGPWEWKGPIIRKTGCAYGKFIENKAAFISPEWFPDFANMRRDGYDFDALYEDELAPYRDKVLYDLIDSHSPILTTDLKRLGNYKKGGNKGFDTLISRLMAECYVIVDDFIYKKDKFGRPYGWGVARYTTPERFLGRSFTEKVYQRTPEESYERILSHLISLFPEVPERDFEKLLKSSRSSSSRTIDVRSWLVPSNPKHFDIVEAFRENDIITWKQGNDNIRPGDTVYMYVGQPYSAIMYRCRVLETDLPFYGHDDVVNVKKVMTIQKLEEYPPTLMNLPEMKKYEVVTVRCTRSMPEAIIKDLSDKTPR